MLACHTFEVENTEADEKVVQMSSSKRLRTRVTSTQCRHTGSESDMS